MSKYGYLHGYSPAEQRRLHSQAKVFEPFLHRDMAFPKKGRIIEVGCGVGAQTAILVRRHPGIRITAVDYAPSQLAAAERFFRRHRARQRVGFVQADATQLPFASNRFDGALYVWLLEHTPDPLAILQETRRVLKPGARLFFREVFDASFYLYPRRPACETYWKAYNAHQAALGGNPNIGLQLPHLLREAGFRDVQVKPELLWFDARTPRLRRQWLDYWLELLLSAAPSLLKHQVVKRRLVEQLKGEFGQLRRDSKAIFYFTPIFGSAAK